MRCKSNTRESALGGSTPSTRPTLDVSGLPDGWVAVTVDIDDRKRLERVIRTRTVTKTSFWRRWPTNCVNWLAPLRNGLQVIRMAGDRDTVERTRTMMDRQLTHLVRLVDDLIGCQPH